MRGLGDLVAVITKYTGIRWVVDKVFAALGRDCGCSARQERWNKVLPFRKEENPLIEELLNSEERCVLCNTITDTNKDIHIDQRPYYVEGVGEVCQDCYHKVVLP